MIKNVQLGIVTCSDDDKLILFNIQAKFAIYIVMRNRNLSYTTLRCKDYASSSCNYLFGQQKRWNYEVSAVLEYRWYLVHCRGKILSLCTFVNHANCKISKIYQFKQYLTWTISSNQHYNDKVSCKWLQKTVPIWETNSFRIMASHWSAFHQRTPQQHFQNKTIEHHKTGCNDK